MRAERAKFVFGYAVFVLSWSDDLKSRCLLQISCRAP